MCNESKIQGVAVDNDGVPVTYTKVQRERVLANLRNGVDYPYEIDIENSIVTIFLPEYLRSEVKAEPDDGKKRAMIRRSVEGLRE